MNTHTPHHWSWKLERRGKASKNSPRRYKYKVGAFDLKGRSKWHEYSCLNGCYPAVRHVVYCTQQPTHSPRFSNYNTHWRTSAMGQYWRQARTAKADDCLPCDAVGVCRCMLDMSLRVYCNMTQWIGLAWKDCSSKYKVAPAGQSRI